MGIVGFVVGFIDTGAVNEGCENAFVGLFVYREVAFAAFQVAGGLLVCMFISRNGVLVLDGQDLCNDAGPGCLFPNSPVSRKVWLWCFMFKKFAGFIETLLNDFSGQALMNSDLACVALVPTAVRLPLVLALLPGIPALLNEQFFCTVLSCGVTSSPDWFLMDVVLWIFEDLLKPGCCVLVHVEVVLIKCPLPCFRLRVIDGVCSFVCSQSGIPLSLL